MNETGADFEQNVDDLLRDVPRFRQEGDNRVRDLAMNAIQQAQERGAATPITFPVNTQWDGFAVSPANDSKDWFYATGSFDHNLTGQITVYPPSGPGGEWRYEADTTVNFRDAYNWDTGKATGVDGKTVTDRDMGRMQEVGWARQYNMHGYSSQRHSSGTGC